MRIQLAQVPAEDAVTASNLQRVLSIIRNADAGTDLIVFPETCLMGFPSAQEVRGVAEPEDGPAVSAVKRAVKERGVSVAVGFAEAEAGHCYNTTVLIDPEGIVLKYRKTHLWGTDVGVFTPGDQLNTAVWNGVRVGILICFDMEFPETARALAAQGAELLIVTNGNMDPYGSVHYSLMIARALENQVFAVMSNRCGTGSGLVFAGESMVVAPTGKVLAALGRDEASVVVEIDLKQVSRSRRDYEYLNLRRLPLAGRVLTQEGTQTGHQIPAASE